MADQHEGNKQSEGQQATQQATQRQVTNRAIDSFIAGAGELELDFAFGLRAFMQYQSELQQVNAGASLADLQMRERREKELPHILTSAGPIRYDAAMFGDNPGAQSAQRVAMMRIDGVMRTSGSLSSYGAMEQTEQLRRLYADDSISGIVLQINSGGGEKQAGDVWAQAIAERNKPVVAYAYTAASAAYRAASQADEILAYSDMAEFGSIGVMTSVDMAFLAMYSTFVMDIYGDGAPNKNEEFRAAIQGDFGPLKARVTRLTEQFHEQVRAARELKGSASKIQETLSGRMFQAVDAKQRGLIDAIGTLQDAAGRINSLAMNNNKKYKRK